MSGTVYDLSMLLGEIQMDIVCRISTWVSKRIGYICMRQTMLRYREFRAIEL
jgi:hypothetical protein